MTRMNQNALGVALVRPFNIQYKSYWHLTIRMKVKWKQKRKRKRKRWWLKFIYFSNFWIYAILNWICGWQVLCMRRMNFEIKCNTPNKPQVIVCFHFILFFSHSFQYCLPSDYHQLQLEKWWSSFKWHSCAIFFAHFAYQNAKRYSTL